MRAYGQKDPLVEYKRESFDMFGLMRERIENDAVRFLFLLDPMTRRRPPARGGEAPPRAGAGVSRRLAVRGGGHRARAASRRSPARRPKVGRNDLCPCGSGKKYKKCHGENAA